MPLILRANGAVVLRYRRNMVVVVGGIRIHEMLVSLDAEVWATTPPQNDERTADRRALLPL
ncbi:hypothetical protein, partial [Rathayibacter iranicus]|uniref:hypothetical protein n=1 Tax=Rathayibacter iranicus TaxID=59737 RepID=UPI001F371E94